MEVNVLEELFLYARMKNASDLHITVGIPPMVRINGELMSTGHDRLLPKDTYDLVTSIMSSDQLAIFEEKGEVDFSYAIPRQGRYRINAFRQRGSAACAIRLVNSAIPDGKALGLPPAIRELYKRKRGLILVTGPTGSGKSTTLASIVGQINHNVDSHVITLEDPIEYLHRHDKSIVNQREMGLDSQNYSNALRAALRQDPDVILVGEMRDLETISTAITAAETGHLVMSTLHTSGAVSTIDRIIDVFPPHQQQQIRIQLSNVLVAVVSQNLIPRIDGNGRVAAFEVLISTPAVRNLIREGKSHQIHSIIQTNKRIGMGTMDDSLMDLMMRGYIRREDALYFSPDALNLEKRLM